MTLGDLKLRGIECYPDNDGGLWYYGKNGFAEPVLEIEEEQEEIKIT